MITLDLKQAAAYLHMSKRRLWDYVQSGDVPAAKPGRKYVFRESDLDAFPVRLHDRQRQALAERSIQCQSTNAETSGISTLPLQAASELDALLGQLTGSKRRNCTTD
jgi:excisionase family DNA binding protein